MSEDYAGGEEIRALIGDLKIRLLRAHVIRFAGDDLALVIGKKSAGLGDAEISKLHITFEGDHDILEADIAMDESEQFAIFVRLGVSVGESARDAADDENGQFTGQDSAFVRQLLGELFEV